MSAVNDVSGSTQRRQRVHRIGNTAKVKVEIQDAVGEQVVQALSWRPRADHGCLVLLTRDTRNAHIGDVNNIR